jgi:CubicO group peptidase (beta-lactamase class C family)
MTTHALPRRALLLGGIRTTAAAFLLQDVAKASQPTGPLDDFIAGYMRAMNAPGLTLSMANTRGAVRTATFGFSDLEAKIPVTPDHLFQIGSITKSFVALTLLQLREEGKLDLQRPILEYLPWLPIQTNYGVVTVHHLLTHSSGLPNTIPVFLSDPSARHIQAFRPGERFYYCNLGFAILGHLITKLDGRPWPEAIRARIFEPLGMHASSAVIGSALRDRMAISYLPFAEDRAYLRGDRLARVGAFSFEGAAGSIASTPADMARYMQMLLNRGQGPHGRVVSAESFALFIKPNFEAPELSPTAHYGYGIGIDQLDGHTILRHTGGMVSFMSALHVDLDGGCAAFASINAMLGYRPNPVTEYAVRLMHAESEKKPAPAAPLIADPFAVKNASDYAGVYQSVRIVANGDRLSIQSAGQDFPLQPAGGDAFVTAHPRFQQFALLFGRNENKPPSVVEFAYGSDLYFNDRYSGPTSWTTPAGYEAFTGRYRGDSPWLNNPYFVFVRKGKLWLDGALPLEPLGGGVFRMGSALFGAETAEFRRVIDGKAQMLTLNGADLWRVEVA